MEENTRELAKTAYRRARIGFWALFAAMVIAAAVLAGLRWYWPTAAVTALFAAALVFYWENRLSWARAYLRFTEEMAAGLTQPFCGRVVSVSPELTARDKITLRPLEVEEPDAVRLLYWDINRKMPELAPGDLAEGETYQNVVVRLTVRAPEGTDKGGTEVEP